MPLLDLVTDLKSLKYGQDRPGGGSSGQPYMQFPLPEAASEEVRQYYVNNRTNLDFPLRGGGFNIGFDGPYVGQAAKYDRERIQKFLNDSPRGPIFILKQQALQLSNPKLQVGSQINLDLGVLPFRFLGNLENTRIYNAGKNTLMQVGVQGSGIHFDRHGNVPINPFQQTYAYVADDRIEGNVNKNRLKVLYETKILTGNKIPLALQTSELIETLNTLGISRDSGLLFQYPGGPSSAGGFGLTTVHRRYTTQLFDQNVRTQANYYIQKGDSYEPAYGRHPNNVVPPESYFGKVRGIQGVNNGTTGNPNSADTVLRDISNINTDPKGADLSTNRLEYLYQKLLIDINAGDASVLYRYLGGPGGTETTLNRYDSTNVVTDAVSQKNIAGTSIGTPNLRSFNYTYNYRQLNSQQENSDASITKDFRLENKADIASTEGYDGNNNIAKKYNIGNPGSKLLNRIDYSKSVDIGNTPIDITQDLVNKLDVGEDPKNVSDLVTFRFETIEINRPSIPIVFRAFLAGISDSHTAEYSPFKYVGRGENFYVYNGFNRQLSFSFQIAAQSRSEMKPLYRKLNFLLSQLYPDYKEGTGFMRAPLIKATIGDYLYNQPGFLTSMNVTIPDDSSWEIANNQIQGADDDMYQLPQRLDVACQFTPIHDFLPRRSVPIKVGNNTQYYITPLTTRNEPGKNKFEIGDTRLLILPKVAQAFGGGGGKKKKKQ